MLFISRKVLKTEGFLYSITRYSIRCTYFMSHEQEKYNVHARTNKRTSCISPGLFMLQFRWITWIELDSKAQHLWSYIYEWHTKMYTNQFNRHQKWWHNELFVTSAESEDLSIICSCYLCVSELKGWIWDECPKFIPRNLDANAGPLLPNSFVSTTQPKS